MKPRIVILGSGGHAKVVIDILEQISAFEIAGCVGVTSSNPAIFGYPALGDDSRLPALYQSGIHHAFIAIGGNARRLELLHVLRELGFTVVNAISPGAIISPRAKIGVGVAVMPGAVINADAVIGDCAIINTGATIDHDCTIGAGAHIAPGSNLAGCVTIGEGAFLGIGCRVIPNTAIGAWTIVGAGGVVVRDLPERVTAVGLPARIK